MKLQLLKRQRGNADTVTFIFKPEEELNFKPGQFLRYHIPNIKPDERGENHFFSIASAPFENRIQLTTKFALADGSTFKKDLYGIQPGDFVEARGPYGLFTIEDSKNYVFIAGGIGVTPFRSILLDLNHRNQPLNITLLYANHTLDILFKDEFEVLALKHPEFKIYYIISDEKINKQDLSANVQIIPGKINRTLIKSLIINPELQGYYVSGPEMMVISLEDLLKEIGVPRENIKRDYYPGYKQY